jgi:hypothetical protein
VPIAFTWQLPRTPADNVICAASNALPPGAIELLIEVYLKLEHRPVCLDARFGVPRPASTTSAAAVHGHACRRTQGGHSFGTFRPAVPLHLRKVADDLPVQPKANLSREAFSKY